MAKRRYMESRHLAPPSANQKLSLERCHDVLGGRHVNNPTHSHYNRPIRDRNGTSGLEERVRAAHDPAEGLHFGKAAPLPRGARIDLILGMGIEADIDLYRNSDAHKEIVQHARRLKGSKAQVKLYDLVE
jgi:hypothetical protein